MRIFELFQTAYNYVKVDDKHYRFETTKGNEYMVRFEKIPFPVKFSVEPSVSVAFALVKDGEMTDYIEQTGDAFAVFSTVGNIVRDYMKTSDINYIVFGADKSQPSRLKLYDTFIKYLPKFMPDWEFLKVNETYSTDLKIYVIKRKSEHN